MIIVRLIESGVQKLLKSEEVQAELRRRAEEIAQGVDGATVIAEVGDERARVAVVAREDQTEDLLTAIDNARDE